MELILATFGVKGAELTCSSLCTAYEVLLQHAPVQVDDALAQLDAERQDLEQLCKRYTLQANCFEDPAVDSCALSVFNYTLVAVARSNDFTIRSVYEADLAQRTGKLKQPLLAPFGIPSVAVLGSRNLLVPLILPSEYAANSIWRAYEGLVRHLQRAADHEADWELCQTAVIWRVSAIIDGLEPADAPLYDKANTVRGRVVQRKSISYQEKALWEPMTRAFTERRHALSHMTTRGGETFAGAVDYALSSPEDLLKVSTAVGFAVLQELAEHIAGLPPPRAQWGSTWKSTQWLEDHF